MAVTPTPKTQVTKDGEYTKFEPSPAQQAFIDAYGRGDDRDCERLREAIKMAFARSISWRKAFFDILNAEDNNSC